MANPFFTIGHSKRPVSEFVGLLEKAEAQLVVDVRTIPRSLANPQYDQAVLPKTLTEFQVEYEHLPELGGLPEARMSIHQLTPFGKTPAFTIMQTTPWARNFGLV